MLTLDTTTCLAPWRGYFRPRIRRAADGDVSIRTYPMMLAIVALALWATVVILFVTVTMMTVRELVVFMVPFQVPVALVIVLAWRTDRVKVSASRGVVELEWRRVVGRRRVQLSLDRVEILGVVTSQSATGFLAEHTVLIGQAPWLIAVARAGSEVDAESCLERLVSVTGLPVRRLGEVQVRRVVPSKAIEH